MRNPYIRELPDDGPVVALVGKPALFWPDYAEDDWHERDNFPDMANALGYARLMSRMHYGTPYRIVKAEGRYAVEYVPEWLLR